MSAGNTGPGITVIVQLDAATSALFAKLKSADDTFRAAMLRVFNRLALRAAAHIVKTQLSGGAAGLRRRTGQLARAITGVGVLVNGVPAMRVGVFRGPALAYANIQEFGGTVLPRKAKALAMPVGDALTPAGVGRYASPRDFPGRLTFIPFRRGGVAIGALYSTDDLKKATEKLRRLRVRASGAAGSGRKLDVGSHPSVRIDWSSIRKLYVLLRRADIPARHYLLNGMRTFIPTIAVELLAALRAVLNGSDRTRSDTSAGTNPQT